MTRTDNTEDRIFDRMALEIERAHDRILRRTLRQLARVNPNACALEAVSRFADAAAAEALSIGRARRP